MPVPSPLSRKPEPPAKQRPSPAFFPDPDHAPHRCRLLFFTVFLHECSPSPFSCPPRVFYTPRPCDFPQLVDRQHRRLRINVPPAPPPRLPTPPIRSPLPPLLSLGHVNSRMLARIASSTFFFHGFNDHFPANAPRGVLRGRAAVLLLFLTSGALFPGQICVFRPHVRFSGWKPLVGHPPSPWNGLLLVVVVTLSVPSQMMGVVLSALLFPPKRTFIF